MTRQLALRQYGMSPDGAAVRAKGAMGVKWYTHTLAIKGSTTVGSNTWIGSAAPTTNRGTTATVYCGELNSSAGVCRTLLAFDWTTLPDNAKILSAKLRMFIRTDFSSNARTYRIYRLQRAWVQNEATWNIFSAAGGNWQTAGGFGANDCEQTPIGSADFTATETINAWKDFILTPTNKAGLDLGYGWMIKADTETDDAYEMNSVRTGLQTNTPEVEITYLSLNP